MYSWEDKCTFIELKLMATSILCKVLNDDVYDKEHLVADLQSLIRRLDAEEPKL
jgi:hypothetical protein